MAVMEVMAAVAEATDAAFKLILRQKNKAFRSFLAERLSLCFYFRLL